MVKNIWRNGVSLLSLKQTNILSAAAVIMFMSLASRLLGLFRDRLLAHYFTSDLVGVYFASFRLPDLLFQILIFGALSVAFIPVFTEYWEKDKNEAWYFTSSLLTIALILFFFLAFLVFIFVKPLSLLIVPGLSKENPAHLALLINLTRIILFSQFFFVISSLLTGVLQSLQRFLIPALAAVFYNLGIIFGLVFLSSSLGIYSAAIGAIIGAFFHFLIQIPFSFSLGFVYKLNFDFSHPGVKEVGKIMLPRSLSLACDQINLIVETILASLISLSSITFFTFAQHLALVPIGLLAVPIAQAALPTLSLFRNQKKIEEFKVTLISSLHQILFLVIPSSVALFILHTPFTRLIFGGRLFTWEATVLTGRTVAFLSLGLFAQAASLLLVRGFYALHDTKTPLKISLFSISLNIFLSLVLILVLGLPVWALGFSASLSAILSSFFLIFLLEKKIGGFNRRVVFLPLVKIILASTGMAIFLWLPIKILDQLVLDTTRTINLLILTVIASLLGLSTYLFLSWLLKIEEAKIFLKFFKKIGNWRMVLGQTPEVLEEKPV